MSATSSTNSAQGITWDLHDLYQNLDDPALERDLASALERARALERDYRGRIKTLHTAQAGLLLAAVRELESLYEQLKRWHDLVPGDVEGAIRLVISQASLFDFDPAAARPSFEEINLRKRLVRARTAGQDAYVRALKRCPLVFGTGPAGTGKTWLAVAYAVQLFERKEVDRIVLSRPAVEAGERLGFLPGDMREKVDPYLRPIYDALYDLMDARIVERALQTIQRRRYSGCLRCDDVVVVAAGKRSEPEEG